jgi:hypothetical protein
MRTALTILVLVLAVLACGCTSKAPAATPATQTVSVNTAIPDMTGVWEGPSDGYAQHGFNYFPNTIFNVTAQKGRVFIGNKEYPRADGKTYYENFTGIVTANSEVYVTDSEAGISLGKLTGPDSMELNYLEEGADTKALIMQLSRKKS